LNLPVVRDHLARIPLQGELGPRGAFLRWTAVSVTAGLNLWGRKRCDTDFASRGDDAPRIQKAKAADIARLLVGSCRHHKWVATASVDAPFSLRVPSSRSRQGSGNPESSAAPRMVEPIDVAEHIRPCIVTRLIVLPASSLGFQLGEEALHRCVVAAVTATTHAAGDAVLFQRPLELLTRILSALIGVAFSPTPQTERLKARHSRLAAPAEFVSPQAGPNSRAKVPASHARPTIAHGRRRCAVPSYR
jgi:hypothetical protein